jgi:hypothetical protein
VPADRAVQSKLLFEAHDAPTGGHLGGRKCWRWQIESESRSRQREFHWCDCSMKDSEE